MRRAVLTGLLTLLVTACTSDIAWNTKDISNLMPDLAFTLTDETGKQVKAEQYFNKVNLLYFGFTNCPDVCPITLARLRALMNRLPENVARQLQVLFVSVDPERDRPASLSVYTAQFGDNFIGLTGSRDQLDTLTRRYRTTYGYGEPDARGNYAVSHGNAVYVFAADGGARLLITGDDSIDSIAEDIIHLTNI